VDLKHVKRGAISNSSKAFIPNSNSNSNSLLHPKGGPSGRLLNKNKLKCGV
jgi:hypothetical protein